MDRPAVPDYWNHNVRDQPLILSAVPAGCRAALDVGCGDGLLTRRLAPLCQEVTGLDRDAAMIRLARQRSQDFPQVGTAVHHMNFSAALTRMRAGASC